MYCLYIPAGVYPILSHNSAEYPVSRLEMNLETGIHTTIEKPYTIDPQNRRDQISEALSFHNSFCHNSWKLLFKIPRHADRAQVRQMGSIQGPFMVITDQIVYFQILKIRYPRVQCLLIHFSHGVVL